MEQWFYFLSEKVTNHFTAQKPYPQNNHMSCGGTLYQTWTESSSLIHSFSPPLKASLGSPWCTQLLHYWHLPEIIYWLRIYSSAFSANPLYLTLIAIAKIDAFIVPCGEDQSYSGLCSQNKLHYRPETFN